MGVEKTIDKDKQSNMAERSRKSSKPIMERRRRERINNSLNELKNLLLETRKKDTSCCSKLEKADILEMTVQHLKTMRNLQEPGSSSSDPIALAHYRAGFNQSAAEISRYLVNDQDIEVQVRTRLLTHLSNSCHAVLSGQRPIAHAQSPSYHLSAPSSHFTPTVPNKSEVTSPIPNNPQAISFTTPDLASCLISPTRLQLMPSTLPNGKIATVFIPSPSTYPATYHQSFPPIQPAQSVPGSSLITSTESSVNPQNEVSPTSTQASDYSTVWRPW